MNSDERRAARRARREEKRAEKRRERIEGCTLERVADLNSLYDAASKAKRGVAWKASVQRYQMRVLRNIAKAHDDLLAGNDIRRGFTEFDIIALLSKNPGRVYDRTQIYERVWNWDATGDPAIVREHVRRIRNKFAAAGAGDDVIETVWGVGYRWVAR